MQVLAVIFSIELIPLWNVRIPLSHPGKGLAAQLFSFYKDVSIIPKKLILIDP